VAVKRYVLGAVALVGAVLGAHAVDLAVAQTPAEIPEQQETPPPESLKEFLKQQWTRPTPPSSEPVPDSADDTINVMRRAMGRASGTPQREPTPKW
jgi:hypothetical protein